MPVVASRPSTRPGLPRSSVDVVGPDVGQPSAGGFFDPRRRPSRSPCRGPGRIVGLDTRIVVERHQPALPASRTSFASLPADGRAHLGVPALGPEPGGQLVGVLLADAARVAVGEDQHLAEAGRAGPARPCCRRRARPRPAGRSARRRPARPRRPRRPRAAAPAPGTGGRRCPSSGRGPGAATLPASAGRMRQTPTTRPVAWSLTGTTMQPAVPRAATGRPGASERGRRPSGRCRGRSTR